MSPSPSPRANGPPLPPTAETHAIAYFNALQLASGTNTILNVQGDGEVLWKAIGNSPTVMDLELFRARQAGDGSQLPVADGDIIRRFEFRALGTDSATDTSVSSSIRVLVDDPAPGDASMGGRFVFATCSAGTVDLLDRAVLDNQVCGVGAGRLRLCGHGAAVPAGYPHRRQRPHHARRQLHKLHLTRPVRR